MIFLLKVGNLFTLILATIYCFQFWPYRRSVITKFYILNLFLLILWSLSLVLALFTEDFQLKMLFTKARQVTNPFLTSNWLLTFFLIFLRPYWPRVKKVAPLLYVLPVATSLTTILSLMGLKSFEQIAAHSFVLIPGNVGLVTYKVGPLLNLQFMFSGLLMILMFFLFITLLFSKTNDKRHLARLFFSCATIQFGMEFYSRSAWGSPAMIQFNTVSYIPMMIALYYAIHKMEFLNIKSFSNQVAFDNLPTPVITINPRGEIWDANKKAFELFGLTTEDIGAMITPDSRFNFIEKKEKIISFHNHEYQVEYHNLSMNSKTGLIVSLTDITAISELNQELSESNNVLKSMNTEILKITSFNKKIQAVLSHDLSGLLQYTFVSLSKLFKTIQVSETDKNFVESVLKTNQSSVELLNNILAWSHDELETEVSLHDLLYQIKSANSILLKEHLTDLNINIEMNGKKLRTSTRMMEAILRNLISNAIKNSPKKSVITITATTKENHLEFLIVDQGPGISREILDNIHEFRPGPKSHYGFGIGLQLTFDFVRQLDGMIRFESSPGVGTKVYLNLPLNSDA